MELEEDPQKCKLIVQEMQVFPEPPRLLAALASPRVCSNVCSLCWAHTDVTMSLVSDSWVFFIGGVWGMI